MKIKKHKTIFYVPGMISLVVLPIICIWYIFSNGYFVDYKSMDYAIDEQFSKKIIKKDPKAVLRNNITYEFNSSLEEEKTKLDNFQLATRKLHQSNDSINGIKVHFGKQMSYEVFIRILDIQAIEKTNTFYQIDNDLYVLGNITRKTVKSTNLGIRCGTSYYTHLETLKLEAEKKEKEKSAILFSFRKKLWYLYFAFFGIGILNILTLLKFHRNSKI